MGHNEIARRHDALRAALLECARMAEKLKHPCGEDPESAQAVRNAQYQAISTTAHIALGTIMGPNALANAPASTVLRRNIMDGERVTQFSVEELTAQRDALLGALRDLELSASTVVASYERNPGNFAAALLDLKGDAAKARTAIAVYVDRASPPGLNEWPCPHVFKSKACGYSGSESNCDKSFRWCSELGNAHRFEGTRGAPL